MSNLLGFSSSDILKIAIVGSVDDYKSFKSHLARMYGEEILEFVIIRPPSETISVTEQMKEMIDLELKQHDFSWVIFNLPKNEAFVRFPASFFLVKGFSDKVFETYAISKVLSPNILSVDDICERIYSFVKTKIDLQELKTETEKIKADKFKLSKYSTTLEKRIETTGNSISVVSKNWKNRLSGLKMTLYFLIVLSSCLLAIFAWGISNPSKIYYGFLRLNSMIQKEANEGKDSLPEAKDLSEYSFSDEPYIQQTGDEISLFDSEMLSVEEAKKFLREDSIPEDEYNKKPLEEEIVSEDKGSEDIVLPKDIVSSDKSVSSEDVVSPDKEIGN